MLNSCQFIGNLGRDPDIRSLQDGTRVANLSLAVTDRWRDKNSGERRERCEWVKVVVFNDRLSEVIEKYLHKGSKIYIEGAMQTRKWTDNQGQDRYTTEIVLQRFGGKLVMLDSKPDQTEGHEPQQQYSGGVDLDDDIPFAPLRDLP